MTKPTMKLGDKVVANYHGVEFEGIIHAFDGSGWIYVRPLTPIVVYGVLREEVGFAPYERFALRVIEKGPELRPEDVVEMPHDCLGGSALRRPVKP